MTVLGLDAVPVGL